jgi:hypothetical protein
VSIASNWFWNCIISVITPYLVSNRADSAKLGSNVFFMWGSLCCISCKFAPSRTLFNEYELMSPSPLCLLLRP